MNYAETFEATLHTPITGQFTADEETFICGEVLGAWDRRLDQRQMFIAENDKRIARNALTRTGEQMTSRYGTTITVAMLHEVNARIRALPEHISAPRNAPRG